MCCVLCAPPRLQVARDIGAYNRSLRDKKRDFVLICPGRFGTQQEGKGIPVGWPDINGSKCIVETPIQVPLTHEKKKKNQTRTPACPRAASPTLNPAPGRQGFNVPPSEGTHFFQNIASFGIGYVTVYAKAQPLHLFYRPDLFALLSPPTPAPTLL